MDRVERASVDEEIGGSIEDRAVDVEQLHAFELLPAAFHRLASVGSDRPYRFGPQERGAHTVRPGRQPGGEPFRFGFRVPERRSSRTPTCRDRQGVTVRRRGASRGSRMGAARQVSAAAARRAPGDHASPASSCVRPVVARCLRQGKAARATGRPRSVASKLSPAAARRTHLLACWRSSRIPIRSMLLSLTRHE